MSEFPSSVVPDIVDHFKAAASAFANGALWGAILMAAESAIAARTHNPYVALAVVAAPALFALWETVDNYRDTLLGHAARKAGGNSGNVYVAKPGRPEPG